MDKNNKNDIQKFLQDAAELETQAFTLEQLAVEFDSFNEHEECADTLRVIENYDYPKLEESINYAQNKFAHEKNKCEECQRNLDYRKKTLMFYPSWSEVKIRKPIPDYRTDGDIKVAKVKGFLWSGLVCLLIAVIGFIICRSMDTPILFIIFAIVEMSLGFKIGGAISDSISIRKSYCEHEKADWRRLVGESESELKDCKEFLARAQKQLNEALEEYEKVKKKHKNTEERLALAIIQKEVATVEAQRCREHALEIRKIIQKMHKAVGIVPPDYRDMDCVLTFQQIFRNDLADTMREAVMIYEQRVFRQEVIRGMDRIYSQLDELNSSMHFMKHTLSSIRANVSMMSQDVYQMVGKMDRIAGGIDENKDLQTQILSETRASRYAAEALQQSQEKCAEYMENIQESNKHMEQYAAEMDWERRNK